MFSVWTILRHHSDLVALAYSARAFFFSKKVLKKCQSEDTKSLFFQYTVFTFQYAYHILLIDSCD